MPLYLREVHRMFPLKETFDRPVRLSYPISPEADMAAREAIDTYKKGLTLFLKKGGIIFPQKGLIIPGDISSIAKLSKEMEQSAETKHIIAVRAQDLVLKDQTNLKQQFHPSDIAFLARKNLLQQISIRNISGKASTDSNQGIRIHIGEMQLGLEEMTSLFLQNLLKELAIPQAYGAQEHYYFDDPTMVLPEYALEGYANNLVINLLSTLDPAIAEKLSHIREIREKAKTRRHIASA